ncbi:mannose-6-phosphate isomerase [Sodiomyces alkalinus F11]|uniref:Mannose-6-phosphate isomerase n=1 Tax=Sodiomyces alkalinus (strain CBS 110278 / VKM F-3762 / F11) TaxID=1314773 RepID=A0A3N2PTC2_SODAK|nr:mannose-6-phosphate isomerase [Sodiomyces alkalinus F11]ROT37750.1 mannose-6-phosphate isomerase [Sodiomyces alkalinus F11]
MASTDRVFQISGTCNNYDWGKNGKSSLAARLCAQTTPDFAVEDDKVYSELWFGDYPDFPGRVLTTGKPLGEHLQKHKEVLLGDKVIREFDAQLPFLPKILSISKALPLQIHPNKELASKLHSKDPDQFSDPNHKPEIAVALSDFEVFAGWKPLTEITPIFNNPAFLEFLPDPSLPSSSWTDDTLREVTRAILLADEATVKRAQGALRAMSKEELGDNSYVLDLLPRLQEQYGDTDPGNLVALLCMNFLTLKPGEALYIPADGIHAYLSGDIVECMARSNNVLNAGFCPRADRNSIDLFAETLTFKSHSKNDVALPRERSATGKNSKTWVYRPPMSEFDMLCTELENGESETVKAGDGPGVAIVTGGEGILEGDGKKFNVKAGCIFFIAPDVEVKWASSKGSMQIYTAVV